MANPGIVVANTTPLINFAEIDRLELLQALFGELLVPVAVVTELQSKGLNPELVEQVLRDVGELPSAP